MTLSLLLACLWVLLAAVIGVLPEKLHWIAAFSLIASGIPLLGFVTYQSGPLWGLIALAAGASTLRWPLFYLGRWLNRRRRSTGE
ncbi:DUF2484 family protein [Rhodovulum sulfidophilum]|uniref:DUF2484 family protein n=1 Tax=Rhodovulum sulfidophilum TaxID=35806 RepID=UPI00192433D6|nr:DUF2484 family protein [Rhodovulum sulfidophilum]MBL3594932.1 DUF2484 family protein [Rhodovulum sulfidophilum]MCE8439110.1 DUF2484 family protein [Rhodovulum sulfidophilum]